MRELAILQQCFYRHPVLIQDDPLTNPWGAKPTYMFQMTDSEGVFASLADVKIRQTDGILSVQHSVTGDEVVPLLEAKLVHQFDHRYATFLGQSDADCESGNARELAAEKLSCDTFAIPRFFLPRRLFLERMQSRPGNGKWLLGYREITNATNERTIIATITPYVAAGRKLPQIYVTASATSTMFLVGDLNSFVLDFIARCKLSSTSLSNSFLSQLPVLPPEIYSQPCPWTGPQPSAITHEQFLLPRVLELTYTAWDLEPFARDCGYAGPPFRWDEERRCLLRAELDAAFFHLYLGSGEWGVGNREDSKVGSESATPDSLLPTPREAVAYILDTFPIVRRKDEQKYNGEYKTKTTILSIYDEMTKSIETGQPYQTHLNPPPADPRVAHPPREAT